MKSAAKDPKRIERRARVMMMEKEIPFSKMEIVRSLLKNDTLLAEEKYAAVIDLIQNCPDKKVSGDDAGRKVEVEPAKPKLRGDVLPVKTIPLSLEPEFSPLRDSIYIDMLFAKYRNSGLFRKKIILLRDKFPGFSFYKRLVPSKDLYKAVKLIADSQQKISSRMPFIMDAILNDSDIEEPVVYNYLRLLNLWMNEIPLLSIRYENSQNMKNEHFQGEFAEYVKYFISFMDLDGDSKEKIIITVETKLRELTTGIKNPERSVPSGDKESLQNEKLVYDYIMTLRSFLPVYKISSGAVDKLLKKKHNMDSIADFILAVAECLIFRRECAFADVRKYFKVQPAVVSREKWMCSENDLRISGKDENSRLIKYRERLKSEIEPLDETYSFIQMKSVGVILLKKAFDDQWKIINKRRHDYGDEYNDNFFVFIDECLAYFSSVLMPFVDGTQIGLVNSKNQTAFKSLFTKEYFASELSKLNDILNDIASYRTNNPTMKISRDEMKKILSGQLSTFNDVRQLMLRIGAVFYNLAEDLHLLFRLHNQWASTAKNGEDAAESAALSRNEVFNCPVTDLTEFQPAPRPFPFYNHRIGKDDLNSAHVRLFSGRTIWGESVSDSIVMHAISFCYQIASECSEERLHSNLQHRKDLKIRLTELIGRLT